MNEVELHAAQELVLHFVPRLDCVLILCFVVVVVAAATQLSQAVSLVVIVMTEVTVADLPILLLLTLSPRLVLRVQKLLHALQELVGNVALQDGNWWW